MVRGVNLRNAKEQEIVFMFFRLRIEVWQQDLADGLVSASNPADESNQQLTWYS